MRDFVRACRPSAIINCAAFTDVDGAESRPLAAIRVNAEAVWCLAGERFARHAERSYVLRLSSLYGGHTRRTTVDWILRQAQAGQRVTAFADRTVSPSYVPDVVEATLGLVGRATPFPITCSAWASALVVVEREQHPDLG